MLVLNNLPNVLMLNGRSTKDEDDSDYEEENEENENSEENKNINEINNNKNNYLRPQMEEIEEDKNQESNSNFASNENNNSNKNVNKKLNDNNDIRDSKNMSNSENYNNEEKRNSKFQSPIKKINDNYEEKFSPAFKNNNSNFQNENEEPKVENNDNNYDNGINYKLYDNKINKQETYNENKKENGVNNNENYNGFDNNIRNSNVNIYSDRENSRNEDEEKNENINENDNKNGNYNKKENMELLNEKLLSTNDKNDNSQNKSIKNNIINISPEKNKTENKITYPIDITQEELNSLLNYSTADYPDFITFVKIFSENVGNFTLDDDDEPEKTYFDEIYLKKMADVNEQKNLIPNYYYFFLCNKQKLKLLKNMLSKLFPYILNKCPELNDNDLLSRVITEIFDSFKVNKEFMNNFHNHIETYFMNDNNTNNTNKNINNNNNNVNNNNDNMNNDIDNKRINELESINKDLIEKNNKLSDENKNLIAEQNKILESKKILTDENAKIIEEKKILLKKLEALEKENKMMVEKLLQKANTIIMNSTISETQNSIPITERARKINNEYNALNSLKASPIINNKNYNNSKTNTAQVSPNKTLEKSTSREKSNLLENGKIMDNNKNNLNLNNLKYTLTDNSINNLKTNTSPNKLQKISLKVLKDFINELYLSKEQYDYKCFVYKLPKETLEEYLYTYLNKKYGLNSLIIEHARSVINGIKIYSNKDSQVLLFGKIMRNEQEEDARFILEKLSNSIEELLLFYIKKQNPLKLINEIQKIFQNKKNSYLAEEEWRGIIFSIYEKQEATQIEKKIEKFINKENESIKMDIYEKYKNSKLSKNNNNNNSTIDYSKFLNTTINSALNENNSSTLNNNININFNKLSRLEKHNLLNLTIERTILYNNFLKIVLDNHIRFRDKQLKNFVNIFKSIDTDKDGILNEEEFTELVRKLNIFNEKEIENILFNLLQKIDPFDTQKFTFSDCVTLFSNETYNDSSNISGNHKKITILEKICFNNNKIEDDEISTINNKNTINNEEECNS